ncbi:MAG: peptidase [Gammaproteobacteria bacterium (ex Lamellibrachia satsuma)]|nr:MAG: ClpXP protease specificity-enhancing factor [Gammaproteobacteria bacterium (ex Lamellibrachia satsuma)]RRS30932.1 MAG: peptidase [Gammaproteobacteria bacterium (ex Lamellibrachia satsuma)]RRS37169.1 MAG: peptidase [Gammaproteobacteria bacterium (ex Lamellibrachia satsuma)]
MTSNKPYMIRALYDWLVDNGETPYLLVNADSPQVIVPQDFVDEGRIVLNLSPSAVVGLELGNEWISFSARFNGSPEDVHVPPAAVLGIYGKESNQGMLFPSDMETAAEHPDDEPDPPGPGSRPALRVVK